MSACACGGQLANHVPWSPPGIHTHHTAPHRPADMDSDYSLGASGGDELRRKSAKRHQPDPNGAAAMPDVTPTVDPSRVLRRSNSISQEDLQL